MGCGCGKDIVVLNKRVDLRGKMVPNNEDHDLKGKTIMTSIGKSGLVKDNVMDKHGVVVGYILVDQNTQKDFWINRSQFIQTL